MVTLAELLNAKYVSGGRDLKRDGGVDCWGFVLEYYRIKGISLPAWEGIVESEGKGSIIDMERNYWLKHSNPQADDVVLFMLPHEKWHCGVVLPDLVSFAHCRMPKAGIDTLDNLIWNRTKKGFYSWPRK